MEFKSRKKFQIPIISIVLLSLAFNFLAAPLALAAEAPTPIKTADEQVILNKAEGSFGLGKGIMWGINLVLTAILLTITKFVALAGSFFDITIRNAAVGGFSNLVAVRDGWKVSRDVANLFFILILLGVAIATILRIQSYNAKQLLPKLIVIALLINFSLAASYMVIDFANLLGREFWLVLTKDGTQAISSSLMAGARFQEVFDTSDIKTQSSNSWALWGNIGGILAGGAAIAVGCATAIGCPGAIALGASMISGAIAGVASWAALSSDTSFKTAVDYFYLVMVPIIISLPLVFVFVFGGILMIIRFAILTLLLVLAPLAFLFYILPTTEKYWHTWWEKLISHAFFFPAFMFLLYVSISIANAMARSAISGNITQNFPFLVDTTTVVVLLISSLLIARTMGIYFAGSVLNWATASRKWLTGAVGGLAARYTTGVVGTAITPAAAKLQERFPILGTAPTRFTGWLRGLGGAEQRAQAMADFAKRLPPQRRAEYFEKLNTQEKAALLGKMSESEQNDMMPFLSGANQGLVRRMVGGQMGAAAAAKFDLERWRRQTPQVQQAQMAGWLTPGTAASPNKNYNPEAATEALRGMNDDEKAKMVDSLKLADPALAAAAENLIESRFSPKDAQNFKIARILRKPEPEQRAEWLAADPTTGLPNLSADDKEALLRKKDAKGQARFIGGFNDADPAEKAMKTAAENMIQTRFGSGEQAAYKEAVIENVASKSVNDLALAVAAMPPEDLKILAKVGDDGKIASLMNTMTDRVKAKAIGNAIKELGFETKYKKYFNPVDKVEFLDQADAAAPDFIDKVKVEIQNTSPRDLSQRTQAKTIDTDNFKKAFLGGGSVTQLVSLIDNPAKVRAVKQMLTEVAGGNIDRYQTDQGAVINTFETQYHNKELGQQIVEIRNRAVNAMSPVERQFIKQIFGY